AALAARTRSIEWDAGSSRPEMLRCRPKQGGAQHDGNWMGRVRGLTHAVIDPAACLRRVAHFGVDDGAADPARPDLGPGLARRHGLFAQADLDDVELLAARVGAPCVGNHLLADLELEIEIG